jgi:hypothetical protein
MDATAGKLAHAVGGEIAVAQVTGALVALQGLVLAQSDRVGSIDVNPLLLTERGANAVDALVVLR